jgi:hypothetical protein
MGWSIAKIENTVKVSKECAKELFEINEDIWGDLEYVTYENKLSFIEDHYEWMDYLSTDNNSKELIEVLKRHKVKGRICFGSLEGDNAGSFWGHEFDGKGNYRELSGKIVWS